MALALAAEGVGEMPDEGLTAMLCSHYQGRFPSEVGAEPLVPMLREIEAGAALRTWGELQAISKDPKRSLDEAHALPLGDEMLAIKPDVLRAVMQARKEKAGE